MVIFGYQDAWLRPGLSHTFAMFAKVDSSAGQLVVQETVDISWLPERLRPGQQIWDWVVPVRGRNFKLPESFAFASVPGMKLRTFGPVEVSSELYEAAKIRANQLDSGAVAYVILDNLFRLRARDGKAGGASNCIHAVSDLSIVAPLSTHVTYGHKASELVFQHFDRFVNKGPARLCPVVMGATLHSAVAGTLDFQSRPGSPHKVA